MITFEQKVFFVQRYFEIINTIFKMADWGVVLLEKPCFVIEKRIHSVLMSSTQTALSYSRTECCLLNLSKW